MTGQHRATRRRPPTARAPRYRKSYQRRLRLLALGLALLACAGMSIPIGLDEVVGGQPVPPAQVAPAPNPLMEMRIE